ncbi:MAG: hypothetical protein GKS01_02950 [Alphaproteobacteria bacterium]|nr:hypothetical protein [Alphaproteobacteria bacterium]
MAPKELEGQNDQDIARSFGRLCLYVGSFAVAMFLNGIVIAWVDRLNFSNTNRENILLVVAFIIYFALVFCTVTIFCMARSKRRFAAVWHMSLITSVLVFFSVATFGYLLLFAVGLSGSWNNPSVIATLIAIPALVAIWWFYTLSQLWLGLASDWHGATNVAFFVLQSLVGVVLLFGVIGALYY